MFLSVKADKKADILKREKLEQEKMVSYLPCTTKLVLILYMYTNYTSVGRKAVL